MINPPLIEGYAEPIQLELELTRIPLNVYVEDATRIDSITSDGPFNYEVDNSTIILLGRPKKPLYVLQLWHNGVSESILLKRTKPKLHSFLYVGIANSVKVKGDFNKWDPETLVLNKNGNSFTDYALLSPGKYEYLFEVDGKEILDPFNRDSVQNEDKWHSVLTIPGVDVRQSPTIDVSRYTSSTIQLSAQKMSNVYVLWQNTLIKDFVTVDENGIKIEVPANANELDKSTIRVWAENDESFSEVLEIELQFGEVVPNEN